MKLKNFLFSAFAAMLAFAGCQKDPVSGEPSLEINPETIEFSASENLSAVVKVKSNQDWRVVDVPEWVVLTVDGADIKDQKISASGKDVKVTVSVTPNTSYDRDVDITFNGGLRARKTLRVSQAGKVTYKTLAEVKAMLPAGQESVTLGDSLIVKAVCNHSASGVGNLNSKKSTYVQDETAGINLYFAADHSFNIGDVMVIDLSGATLKLYNKAYEIEGLPLEKVSASSGPAPEAKEISAADLLANKYEGMYVAINDVQVADADLGKTWYHGTQTGASINVVTKTGDVFIVRSSKYSTYKDQTVAQGSGTIKGIATVYNSDIQLVFAQTSDFAGLTGERFAVTTPELTVDQTIAKKSGSVIVKGRVIAAATPGFVLNDGTGNNLYVAKVGHGVAKDDIVKVSGDMTTYGPAARLNASEIEKITETISATPAQQTKALGGNVSTYTCNGSAEKISISGMLVTEPGADGVTYYNLDFDGIEKPQGSIYTDIDISGFVDKRVVAEGYFAGSTASYFMIVAESVTLDESDFLSLSAKSADVAASATSASFNISSNVDWTVKADSWLTVDKASGNGNGTINITFSANTDPANGRTGVVTVSSKLGNETFTVNQSKYVDPASTKYVKVTSAPTDWSGSYLIVYEPSATEACVFNGQDVANGFVSATIASGAIAYSADLEKVQATIAKMDGGYSIMIAGKYIGGKSNSNSLVFGDAPTLNTISCESGCVVIVSDTTTLMWNDASNQKRFRYYKTRNQKDIQLYKLQGN